MLGFLLLHLYLSCARIIYFPETAKVTFFNSSETNQLLAKKKKKKKNQSFSSLSFPSALQACVSFWRRRPASSRLDAQGSVPSEQAGQFRLPVLHGCQQPQVITAS